jgi:hypothetical protein
MADQIAATRCCSCAPCPCFQSVAFVVSRRPWRHGVAVRGAHVGRALLLLPPARLLLPAAPAAGPPPASAPREKVRARQLLFDLKDALALFESQLGLSFALGSVCNFGPACLRSPLRLRALLVVTRWHGMPAGRW